jgi:putative lipoprotein
LKIDVAAFALLAAAAPASAAAQEAAAQPTLPLQAPKSFICTDGRQATLDVDEAAGVVRVVRDGEVLVLHEQVGHTPRRFVTGASGVDLDGDKATIKRGIGRLARTVATCARVPAAPAAGTVWGTLTKLDRRGLPDGTKAKVLLVDAARADAPAVEIASTSIVTAGNQVPLHFLLNYPTERVTPRAMTYRLQARIERPDGELQYITDTATFVLESEAPQPPVELTLARVPPSPK